MKNKLNRKKEKTSIAMESKWIFNKLLNNTQCPLLKPMNNFFIRMKWK